MIVTAVQLYGAGQPEVSQGVTVGSLPDDVLLEIFYQVYQGFVTRYWHDIRYVPQWNWHHLVHVCQRWRSIIFSLPRHLKLQVVCTPRITVWKLLDIWPTLPLRVCFESCTGTRQSNNLIEALENHGRIHSVHIGNLQGTLWERISTVMEGTFPELTSLSFQSRPWFRDKVFLPDTFLNGTAPSLQYLIFRDISFPSLPQLLLTATNLTYLRLEDIPNAGYISPEAMATCLSTLPRLKILTIKFQIWTLHPNRRNRPPPPPTRFVLPALIRSGFKGNREYLEVLAARIDAPLLGYFEIDFFDDLNRPFFDIPEIIRFLAHLELFRPSKRLTLILSPPRHILISFELDRISRSCRWCIVCKRLDWQLISAIHICSRILSFRSSVESLTILYANSDKIPPSGIQPDEIEPTIWLQLFRPFTSLQNLLISTELERSIANALQGFTRRSVVEVFPSIDLISIVEKCGGVICETKLAYNRSLQPVNTL